MTEGFLELALETSADAFLALNCELRVHFANPAARMLFSANGPQLEGVSLWDLFPTLSHHGVDEALQARREYTVDCRLTGGDRVQVRLIPADHPLSALVWLRPRVPQQDHLQKQDSLGLLAGGIAHDFNNILTGILGNASLGLYSIDESSEARPLIEEVVRAGERAAGLTRQLLAYAGKGRFQAAPTDMNALAREVSELAPASLILDLADGLPTIQADSSQLRQVIHSLVMNAVEAVADNDGGEVRVVTRIATIGDSSTLIAETGERVAPGSYALFEVQDTGVGMDAATRARIFEPFFTTKFTGRGMGLSAVLGIVRRHGGALCLDSVLGEGSTFRVLLPLTEPAAAKPSIPAGEISGMGLVLVVDDEETVRDTARRALEHWRYRVVLAENGQAAVEIFPEIADRVRVVMLDLTMPVMGGEETLDHLRRIRPGVPIILTSGYSEAEAMRRMEGKDVSAFLQKPFTAEQIGAKLRALLDIEDTSEFDGEGESISDRK